ncbi:protein kinase [Micromonospora chersina]|uniref:protein kinase domain-containing protein n=1 Tax=Micromonospora chersina TaxID=47854 RepID=UPI00345710DE
MTAPTRIGTYRVERLLGAGSFATVWLAYDPALDGRVAIKVLAENWSHDLRVRERFLDEARLLRRLDHDRLVRVHTVGELPDGRPYAVLAWADGGSLRDRLARGPLPAAAAVALLDEIAAGVAVLHRHGVVHRDLTPGNILFRSGPGGERVLVADLGLAKALAAASGLTARGGDPRLHGAGAGRPVRGRRHPRGRVRAGPPRRPAALRRHGAGRRAGGPAVRPGVAAAAGRRAARGGRGAPHGHRRAAGPHPRPPRAFAGNTGPRWGV